MNFDIYRKFRIHRTKIIFLGSFLAVFIFFVISLNFFVYRILDDTERVQFLRSRPWLVKTLPILRSVRKITDLADIFYYFKSSDLPVYSLKIDPANIKKLEDALPEGFTEEVFMDNKFYVPAKFYADGKEYDVKVRYRGDNSIHWESDKKSYLINFDDENLFNGINRLSFIIPDDRKFAVEQLNNYRAEKLGLKHPISYFGNLKVNGRNNGLYFLIENWSSEMEAKWEIPDPSNLYGGADPIIWLGRTVDEDLWQNVGLWDLKVDNELLGYKHYSEIYKLLDIINNYNDEDFKNSIFNLVDKDTFFSWLVHQNLSHSNHQTGPNLRMYFNYSDGKFYVVSWDVDNFPAEENIDSVYNALITRVLSQPEFVYERNKLLWNYVSDKENLEDDLREYDRIIESIRVDLYKDRLKIYTNNWADNLISTRRQFYQDIFDSIRESLKQSRVFSDLHIELDRRNNILDKDLLAYIDITVDSHPEVFWQNFIVPLKESDSDYHYKIYRDNGDNVFDEDDVYITELVKNDNDQLSFDGGDQKIILYAKREVGDMYGPILPIPNKQRFFIVSENGKGYKNWLLDDIDISFDNAITGKKITGEEKQFKIINDSMFTYFDDLNKNPKDFLLDFPQFRFIENHFILSSGQYYFDRNVVFPSNYDLIIEPGTVISMASDTSIVVHGAIIADGSDSRIYINSSSKEPWGTLVSLSSKKQNIFKNFWADNGSESYINGTYVSGMVSVHDGDVVLENSLFTKANGDDGFNIKWGNAQIINNTFSNNSFDALDVDWGNNSLIKGNVFSANGNDGMDIGGGNNMKIINNTVENSGDKCISIGENAKNIFVFNNWLEGCIYGIAIKDGSDVVTSNNTLLYNQIGLGVYQKKPVWGGATAKIYNSVIWWSDKLIDIDEKSSVKIEYSNIEGEFSGENNINVEPVYNNKKPINEDEFFMKGANMDIIREFTDKNFAPMGVFDL